MYLQPPKRELTDLRPASMRRIESFLALIAALNMDALDLASIAEHLGCSMGTARIYIYQLRDAKLVAKTRVRQTNRGSGRGPAFQLVGDAAATRIFVNQLMQTALVSEEPITPQRRGRETRLGGNYFHVKAGDLHQVLGRAALNRDPLVAALFGSNTIQVQSSD